MGISDRLRKIKGSLHRKYFEKTFLQPVERKTRALQMLSIMREEPKYIEVDKPRKIKMKKLIKVYPRFAILPAKSFISIFVPDKVRSLRYALLRPYTYSSVRWDIKEDALVYHVIEPAMSSDEKSMLEKIREGLIQTIDVNFESIKTGESSIEFLEKHVQDLLDSYGFVLSDQEYLKIMYYIYRDFVGLNEIEPLLHDPYIEDISCDGVGIPVYIIHQKLGSLQTNIVYNDDKLLRSMVVKLAERSDRYISYAEPLLDGTLPDGSRVQASLAADVTTRGPTFTIRKFRERPFTPVDMVELGTASSDMLAYLWFAIEQGSNILICGGVATGKTSFLNNLSLLIPPDSKIVSIEDTRELNLPHENWIPAVARMGFTGTKVGEVDMFKLLKESFRQNPDYLIVGEVRGKEASVMFQGLASGHPGISTIHAGGVDDVIKRLETAPINLSPGLLETLDIIIVMVHAREKGKSARRVKHIVEVESIDITTGKAQTHEAFSWIPSTDGYEYKDSRLLEKISADIGIPMEKIVKEIDERKRLIDWLVKINPKDWTDVAKYIGLYYRDKKRVMDIVRRGSVAKIPRVKGIRNNIITT